MFVIAVCSALAVVVNVYGKCFGSRSKSTRPSEKHAKEHASSSEVSVARRSLPQLQPDVDTELSNRSIALDPAGYFVIRTEKTGARESYIIATYYTNTINKDGFACNPDTGEVIPCGKYTRAPTHVFRGKSAKELSVQILEGPERSQFCTHLEHANYLGREFQKAECAILWSLQYVQD